MRSVRYNCQLTKSFERITAMPGEYWKVEVMK